MQDAEKNIENNPIDKHEVDHTALLNAVKIYEERIKEIEGSVYWKAYLFFIKRIILIVFRRFNADYSVNFPKN